MDIYGNKLVNTIETKPLCISLSNLADMLTMMRGWIYQFWRSKVKVTMDIYMDLSILEVRGQRSRSQWTYMEISLMKLVNTKDTNRCVFLHQTWQTC